LLASLNALRIGSHIANRGSQKKINVVVSMSSAHMYSQVLNLPMLQGSALGKAVDLNLQMAAPEDASKTYSGWEIVGKNEGTSRLDILSAFVDRDIVDAMIDALFAAGFLAMALEPRLISLTRILREKGSGIDPKKPYLFLDIDNIGIDFLVILNGLPYFEYTNLWKDIANSSGEISVKSFEEELAMSLRQVINFYNQHWTEPVGAIIIAATTLHESIEKVVAAAAAFPAVRLTLEMGQPISSQWLVAIGCSLRGVSSQGEDGEISLLGVESEGRFQEEQLLEFTRFWEVLIPIAFGILVAVFFAANGFVVQTRNAIEHSSQFNVNTSQTAQIAVLAASTTQFNDLVAMTQAAESSVSTSHIFLEALQSAAQADGVTINTLSYPGSGMQISLSGSASSEDRIIAFKTDLGAAPGFSNLSLPPTSVQGEEGSYTFQLTFDYSDK
jgi:hypothetical protein